MKCKTCASYPVYLFEHINVIIYSIVQKAIQTTQGNKNVFNNRMEFKASAYLLMIQPACNGVCKITCPLGGSISWWYSQVKQVLMYSVSTCYKWNALPHQLIELNSLNTFTDLYL